MAFSSTLKKVNGTNGSASSFSLGPVCVEMYDIGAVSGDTSGTITSNLRSISHVSLTGLIQTALPSVSGSTVTFAFSDPVATVKGHVMIYGAK